VTVIDGRTPPAVVAGSSDADEWVDVCAFDGLVADRGVAALVHGVAVAVFRCSPDDELFAVDNIDPYGGASVLSRGIVGSIDDRPIVISPLHKQRFDLASGEDVDDPSVRLDTWSICVSAGRVLVAARPRPAIG